MRTIQLPYPSYRFLIDITICYVCFLQRVMKEHFETIFTTIITSNTCQRRGCLAIGTQAVAVLVGLLGVRRALAWARERSMAMMESIRRASYIHEVGKLTDKVARATFSSYVRGSRATSFSMV